MEAGSAPASVTVTVTAPSLDLRLGLTKVRTNDSVKCQARPTASGSPQVSGPTENGSWSNRLMACQAVTRHR
jgi:hypothetical protein